MSDEPSTARNGKTLATQVRDDAEVFPQTEPREDLPSGLPLLSGWRLTVVILSLALSLLLSSLETSIIATALVTISSDLGHFDKSTWIVVVYLLTYTGFLIVFARLSDIFGRKQMLLVALAFFTIGSLACGFARTIEQLIVFRAFQGIGGSGIYSLAMATIPEVTPVEKLGLASSAVSGVMACSSVLGPILGGVITSNATWRWVFWLNIPAGVMVFILIFFIFPLNLGQKVHSKVLYAQIDWPGVVLSLGASVMLVFALESGGSQFGWRSATIVVSFIVSGICWIAFSCWETFLTNRPAEMLPIFPTRLVAQRVIAASLVSAFFTGFPFMPVNAGIRMLPLLLSSAVGAASTGILCSKKNISSYLLIFSNALQILGTGLLTTLPVTQSISASQYGFQVMMGFGFAMSLTCLIIISRIEVIPADHELNRRIAVTMGAITQVRVLGGVIGLAIAQAALGASVRSDLSTILTQEQLAAFLESSAILSSFPSALARQSREAYGHASNLQMRIVMGFACASLVASMFTWRRHIVEFKDAADRSDNRNRDIASAESEGPIRLDELRSDGLSSIEGEDH